MEIRNWSLGMGLLFVVCKFKRLDLIQKKHFEPIELFEPLEQNFLSNKSHLQKTLLITYFFEF